VRRVAVVLAVVAGVWCVPSSAGAAYLTGFSVRDIGSEIRWSVTVCGNVYVRRFRARLEPEEQGIGYSRTWSAGRNGRGCHRWRMYTDDVWLEQVWDTQLTAVLGNGALLRTPWKAFYIS
jgi:hypothetical protein